MPQLDDLVPTAEVLLAMSTEDLGHILLKVAKSQLQNGFFWPDSIGKVNRPGHGGYPHTPFPAHEREVELALAEALVWLRNQALIVPAPGINGANGFMMLSRTGERLADQADVDSFRQAAEFPKALLHPAIADRVWSLLNRGDFGTAMMEAFRAVEEAIRDAAGFPAGAHGVRMMRDAFHKENGPLTDANEPETEREALAHLFAGAIGRYRNPLAHRIVKVDVQTAREACVLASHLLRIVDNRRQ
jgi:uncharacterized protein (TIGR02391 family)